METHERARSLQTSCDLRAWRPSGAAVGRVSYLSDRRARYARSLRATVTSPDNIRYVIPHTIRSS